MSTIDPTATPPATGRHSAEADVVADLTAFGAADDTGADVDVADPDVAVDGPVTAPTFAPSDRLFDGWPGVPRFGTLPVPLTDAVANVGIDLPVGRVTALHARPEASARGVVLLVPGFTGSKEDFGGFLPLLAERGWDAWSYSQRGQADSAAPAGAENYTLEAFAQDVVAVAALVGSGRPVHLLGHSFGGVVARAAAILAPEAFLDVTLLCSGPHGWTGRMEREAAIVSERGSAAWWNEDNAHTVGLPDAALTADEAFRRLRMGATSDDQLLGAAAILSDENDTTGELLATGLDTLVAHGVDDPAWPQDWQASMAGLLDARYAIIPEAAHSPQLENPEATADLLDEFWGRDRAHPAVEDPQR
ncbi:MULTISPECIES: alpha/beta fold hydrolase [unclassified Cryobacterium]|uniref:alpha/beta fold hydrolase n=1 Tax=unclassified Cryobacterium TaxID=2649013 RepID=UPI002AB47986|nr:MULTISPECIES: alpha/beta fold hydrolase [unclassified Cryobacterium]MDY7542350.1 alpha/beta fold hydrolase [Cryobacterium sp. 5B3]MEB0000798.1 alpha/beta fold hydrolase [Cryobacterium sp. RTS3]MEB0267458.1 alpha/beta fold hydrolase [Cryobacterium sp. 10I5]MEB0276323.1 alpha/beta fold hydrolase [Cryobacterium sp. 5B3]